MRTVTILKRQQAAWAQSAGKAPDKRGYVSSVELNLRAPLDPATRNEFRRGSGGELVDRNRRPAKMRAVHSSSALAVNFFDFWRSREKEPLARALRMPAPIAEVEFEKQLSTGLVGTPPNLDVFLVLESGKSVAIESKFTEAYGHSPAKLPFKAKYFPRGRSLWSLAGLPRCQRLAESIANDPAGFRLLNAPQLLKHALGIATQYRDTCSLVYLYFDHPGAEGQLHRKEVAAFAGALGSELGFRALSYQDAFAGLQPLHAPEESEYLLQLAERYFA